MTKKRSRSINDWTSDGAGNLLFNYLRIRKYCKHSNIIHENIKHKNAAPTRYKGFAQYLRSDVFKEAFKTRKVCARCGKHL